MVGWSVCKEMPVAIFLEGGNVQSTVDFQTRRELIKQMVPRYQKASISQKGVLLDEIAATTGYARRYAMWLLNHAEQRQFPPLLAYCALPQQNLPPVF